MPSLNDFKRGQAESVGKKLAGKVIAESRNACSDISDSEFEKLCNDVLNKPVDETSLDDRNGFSYVSEIEPDVLDGFARAFGYELVGHGKVKNRDCGRFVGHKVCLNVGNHHASLDGSIHEGDVFDHKVIHHCNNFRCPKCYLWGASVREADRIEQKLAKGAKVFGMKAEHGTVQVPFRMFGWDERKIRKAVFESLYARGIVGGVCIFHPFAYNDSHFENGVFVMAEWTFRPHYHFLAFFQNEYGRCRNCKFYNAWGVKSVRGRKGYRNHGGSACLDCGGFEGLTRRLFKEDGFIVKVFDERKSVFKTAMYELSHAGLKVNAVRPHITTYFGNCASSKFKVVYETHKCVCPVCKIPLVNALYFGRSEAVSNIYEGSTGFERELFTPMFEDGLGQVWCKGDKKDIGG